MDSHSKFIVEAFKESVTSRQFLIALSLYKSYDYILLAKYRDHIYSLIEVIGNDPYFMEIKLILLDKFLQSFDFDTAEKV